MLFFKTKVFEYWQWSISQQVLFVLGFAMVITALMLPIYYFFTNGKGSLSNIFKLFKSSKPTNDYDSINESSDEQFGDEGNNEAILLTKPLQEHVGIRCGFAHLLGPILFLIIAIGLILIDAIVIWTIPDGGNAFSQNLFASFFFFPYSSNDGHYDIFYPTINWIAVALLGIIFGHSIIDASQRTRSMVSLLAISSISLFIIFPAFQFAGAITTLYLPDSEYWKDDLQSFFYVIKYPPSFCFLAVTLGFLGICLSLFYITRIHMFHILWPLEVFGKASLFFYVVHLWWFALIGLVINNLDLAGCYVIWFISLFPLFIFCHLFGKFKHSTSPDSFWRLF